MLSDEIDPFTAYCVFCVKKVSLSSTPMINILNWCSNDSNWSQIEIPIIKGYSYLRKKEV